MQRAIRPMRRGARSHWILWRSFLSRIFLRRFPLRGEWREVEGDVGGLEALGLGVGDVVGQRAVGGVRAGRALAGRRGRGLRRNGRSEQAGGDGLGVGPSTPESWPAIRIEGWARSWSVSVSNVGALM